ncbi:GGDEF domain-containing protein [Lysobacter sp. A3-1-A15]|uniref:GGDEF domain-containing protein n=1 Tax=Novilysobacter viscosus TaxID=3098602 RepID=UPI002EDAF002
MLLRSLCCVLLAVLPLHGLAQDARTAGRQRDDAHAHPAPALETIAAVRVDSDGDNLPDRLGTRAHVRGIATVPTGDRGFQTVIQDRTGGIGLFHRGLSLAVKPGDVLEAVGEVAQYRGAVQLRDVDVRIVGHAPLPKARTLPLADAAGWRYMGQRLHVRGRIEEVSLAEFGLVNIRDDKGTQFALFVPDTLTSQIDWQGLSQGAEVAATGVLSIHKMSLPYDSGFQLILGDSADMQVVAPPVARMPRWVLWAVAATVGLVSLVLLAFHLVHRRHRERDREIKTLAALSSTLATTDDGETQLARHACDILTAYGVVDAAMVQVFDDRGCLQQVAVSTVDPQLGKTLEGPEAFYIPGHLATEHGRQIEERVADKGLSLLAVHPLLTQSGSLGFLVALSPRRRKPTAAQDRTLLASVKLLTMALENQRSHERARAENRELQQLVITDELTRLYNRRFLDEYLRVQVPLAVRRGSGLAFLALDIDHFKRINDTHGHHVGDRVLSDIGVLLRQASRSSDLAVRLGGEEFLLVIAEDTTDGAVTFAERLRKVVQSQPFDAGNDGVELDITISIGVAVFGVHGDSAGALLRAADEAMYASKQAGRNRVTLAPTPAGKATA